MMIPRAFWILCLLCCCLQQAQGEDSIRKRLAQENPVWYDKQADSWKRSELEAPEKPIASEAMNTLRDILIPLMYAVIIGLVLYLLYLFISHMSQRSVKSTLKPKAQAQIKSVDLESLPFQNKADSNDPHQILQDAQQQQNWPQVIIYCLIVLLIELHRARLVQIQRGKTNGHYLRELQAQAPNKAKVLKHCIALFEKSYFGHQAINPDQAQQLFDHVQNMKRMLHADTLDNSGKEARA